jgi:hypothetical protein
MIDFITNIVIAKFTINSNKKLRSPYSGFNSKPGLKFKFKYENTIVKKVREIILTDSNEVQPIPKKIPFLKLLVFKKFFIDKYLAISDTVIKKGATKI